MSLKNLICLIIPSLALSSCGGFDRNYIGARMQPTSAVQIYYHLKDIKQAYKVIGHFVSAYPCLQSNQERVKAKLIEEAKKVGADALVFSEVNMKNRSSSTDYSIKADAIKYLKE